MERPRPSLGRLLILPRLIQLPGAEGVTVVRRFRPADQHVQTLVPILPQHPPSDFPRVASHAEPLRSEVIRQPPARQHRQNRPNVAQSRRVRLTHPNDEPIALQMPDPKLVAVTTDAQDADARNLQRYQPLRFHVLDAEVLLRDGPGVLQTRIADLTCPDTQRPTDQTGRLHCRQSRLLHPEVGVRPLHRGLVQRHLLHAKVLGSLLDHTGNSRNVASQKGQGG